MLNFLPLKDAPNQQIHPPISVSGPLHGAPSYRSPPRPPDGHPLARPGSIFGAPRLSLPHPTPTLSTATARCQRCRDESSQRPGGKLGEREEGEEPRQGVQGRAPRRSPTENADFRLFGARAGGGSPSPSDLLLGVPAPARAPRLPRRACLRLLQPLLQPRRRRPQHRPRPEEGGRTRA